MLTSRAKHCKVMKVVSGLRLKAFIITLSYVATFWWSRDIYIYLRLCICSINSLLVGANVESAMHYIVIINAMKHSVTVYHNFADVELR